MTELRTCAHCGTAEGELTEFNGRLYCPDCLDDLTLVCTDCGNVTEVRNPALSDQAMAAGRHGRFTPSYFTMYVYGLCARCKRKRQPRN